MTTPTPGRLVGRVDGQPVDAQDWVRSVHEQHAGALFVFAYRALGDRQTAEEIVQDTLVRAWQHADGFDPERASLGTWLFAIARNLIVDARRRRNARPDTSASATQVPEDIPSVEPDLDRLLESWQVAEALGRLTPEHRDVIIEAYYRGTSVADAARRLSIPEGTVKSRLYYALRSLRLVLDEMGVVR